MCNIWAVDGTFDIVCCMYTQLFTIHGITNDGFIFPFVYALLPNKTTESYKYVLEQLSDNTLGYVLRPEIVILDFEKAVINGVKEVYPDATLHGCYFHWTVICVILDH